MSKISYAVLSLGLVTLLTACGGGSKDDPNVNTYGYNGRGRGPGPGFANQCAPRVAMSWNQNIAAHCNNVNGQQMAAACAAGTLEFRQNAGRALPCNIAVADTQFGDGQWNQPNAGFFEINQFVLDNLMFQHGWAIGRPNGPGNPGPGGPGGPGHGPGPGPGPRF